jgi:hypothetical protein
MIEAMKLWQKGDISNRKEAFKEAGVCYSTWSGKRTSEEREILLDRITKELQEESEKKALNLTLEVLTSAPVFTTPVSEPRPKTKKLSTKKSSGRINRRKLLPEELKKFKEVIDLVAKGTPVIKSLEIVGIDKGTFYLIRKRHSSYFLKLEEAKTKGTLVEKTDEKEKPFKIVKTETDKLSKQITEAKAKAKKDREENPEEFTAIMENPITTKQFVSRIEDALTDHMGGDSLQDAMIKHKISLAKYLQLLRFDVNDLIDTDMFAKHEYSKLK